MKNEQQQAGFELSDSKIFDLINLSPGGIRLLHDHFERAGAIHLVRTILTADRKERGMVEPVAEKAPSVQAVDTAPMYKALIETRIALLTCSSGAAKVALGLIDAVLNAAPQQPSVPDGWQLVPVDPTTEMLDAAARASMQHLLDCINDPAKSKEVGSEKNIKKTHASRYSSMLAAAPKVVQP